jgi:hypothetical protein
MKLFGGRFISLLLFVALLALPAAMSAQVVVAGHAPYVAAVAGPAVIAGESACQWGYYSYYPYTCAPYGYYGANWFVGGVFVGVGPWYGGRGFYGRAAFRSGLRGFAAHGFAPRGAVAHNFTRFSPAVQSVGRR